MPDDGTSERQPSKMQQMGMPAKQVSPQAMHAPQLGTTLAPGVNRIATSAGLP